jgi:hypothetical protein
MIMLKLGIKWGLVIGYLLCTFGLYLESLLDVSDYLLMLGYFLCRFGALASTLGYGAAISLWFEPSQVPASHSENSDAAGCPDRSLSWIRPRP